MGGRVSLITVDLRTAETAPPPPPPPVNENLYSVKVDQETYSWGFKVRPVVHDLGSAPAVNRTGEITDPANFRRADFTKAWQFFWADLLAMKRYGKTFAALNGAEREFIVQKFNDLTNARKFLTNKAGTDNKNNHITGEMRGEDPKIDPLICADSVVEIVEARTSTSGKTQGIVMARLKTFMQTEMPPTVTMDLLNNDPRILRATVIYPDGHLTPFPHFEGDWVPYPYVARQECWYPLRDLKKVS